MKGKFLIVGALVGGIVLFFWGYFTHGVLGERVMDVYHTFKDEAAVFEAIKANAPANGVYFLKQGVVAVVAFTPSFADKTLNITPQLVKEFLSDVATSFLLAWLLLGARSTSTGGRAGFLAMTALAAAISVLFSYWNWYEFSTGFILTDALDLVGGWFITGLILAAIQKKMVPA